MDAVCASEKRDVEPVVDQEQRIVLLADGTHLTRQLKVAAIIKTLGSKLDSRNTCVQRKGDGVDQRCLAMRRIRDQIQAKPGWVKCHGAGTASRSRIAAGSGAK